jgi:hypothetical protein
MDRLGIRSGTAWALALFVVGGCESTATHAPYVDNPLLQARQPLLQTQSAASADPTRVAQATPRMVVVPPPGLYPQPQQQPQQPLPTPTFASGQPVRYSPAVPTTQSATRDAGPALPPMLARAEPTPAHPTAATTPAPAPIPPPIVPPPAAVVAPATTIVAASIPAPIAPTPVVPAVDRKVDGKYGHAADYTWLQGELDRHYRGHLELRYRPASEDDPYGGKVRLDDDPRLAQFRPGDIIMVEGELLTDPDGPNAAPWAQYRRFHVRTVRLVERK